LGIFHTQQHLLLQAETGWHSFSIIESNRKTIHGIIRIHIHEYVARSPLKSPFGSFLFSKDVSLVLLDEFVRFVEEKLKAKRVESFQLKNQPEIYEPSKALTLKSVLMDLGYTIREEETSAVIPVDGELFESRIHRTKKPRLKKCREQFELREVPNKQLGEVYDFLNACRAEKDYTLSLSLKELKRTIATFSDRFVLHQILDQQKMIAASISIRINANVLYAFYYDHLTIYDPVSPVVFLCDGLYNFCQKNQLSLLDLGTSNPDGKLNQSLLDFKLSLGAVTSSKFTFQKVL
jgi:hypothetical protein